MVAIVFACVIFRGRVEGDSLGFLEILWRERERERVFGYRQETDGHLCAVSAPPINIYLSLLHLLLLLLLLLLLRTSFVLSLLTVSTVAVVDCKTASLISDRLPNWSWHGAAEVTKWRHYFTFLIPLLTLFWFLHLLKQIIQLPFLSYRHAHRPTRKFTNQRLYSLEN